MAAGIMQWHARSLSLLCPPPHPFQKAEAKLGIPARLDSDACEGFWRRQRKNTRISFQAESKLFLHPPPHSHSHLPRRGKRCREDLRPLERAISLQSVEPAKTSVSDFLTTKVKAGLSLTASKRSSTSRLALAEVKDPQQMCPIRRP